MIEALQLRNIAWGGTTLLEAILLVLLLRRKVFQDYPWFFGYVLTAFAQSVGAAFLYRESGWKPETVWNIAWGTQALVVLMRALTLVELIRSTLAKYSGIWGLTRRVLAGVAVVLTGASLLFSKGMYQWVIMNAVRGLELAMAAVIVAMLLFARYYRLPVPPMSRALGVGLCLYSAFYVLDYSLLENVLQQFADFWNFLALTTFIASLLLWIHAANRYTAAEAGAQPATVPPVLYGKLSGELNLRLHLLDRELTQILRSQERRP